MNRFSMRTSRRISIPSRRRAHSFRTLRFRASPKLSGRKNHVEKMKTSPSNRIRKDHIRKTLSHPAARISKKSVYVSQKAQSVNRNMDMIMSTAFTKMISKLGIPAKFLGVPRRKHAKRTWKIRAKHGGVRRKIQSRNRALGLALRSNGILVGMARQYGPSRVHVRRAAYQDIADPPE